MPHRIRIWLTKKPSGIYTIRWVDPETGDTHEKSTRTRIKNEAERHLGEIRAELVKGRYDSVIRILWKEFRQRYEREVLPTLASKTQMKINTVLNAVEKLVKPTYLMDLTAQRISRFQAELRDGGRADNTITGYLAHLRSALSWAVDMELLPVVPRIRKPRRVKSEFMKGRPITQTEFDRMLESVEEVVGAKAAPSWCNYLEGLWWSGLRLSESLELWWNNEAKLQVVFVEGEVMLRIPGELEKGKKDRLLAIAPEFQEFLLKTPNKKRTGRVFKLRAQKNRGERLTADRVTRIVAKIGRTAGVLVDQKQQKYASAHDLRRSLVRAAYEEAQRKNERVRGQRKDQRRGTSRDTKTSEPDNGQESNS